LIEYNNVDLKVDLGNDTTLCENQILTLSTGSSLNHLWSNGLQNTSLEITESGLYWAEVSKGLCKKRDSINIFFRNLPEIFLGNDTTLCAGDTLILYGSEEFSNLWSDSTFQNQLIIKEYGEYWLEVNDGFCIIIDSIAVEFVDCENINSDMIILFPNVFSPNNDGKNDFFEALRFENVGDFKFYIFIYLCNFIFIFLNFIFFVYYFFF
jgi:hypothetical protein